MWLISGEHQEYHTTRRESREPEGRLGPLRFGPVAVRAEDHSMLGMTKRCFRRFGAPASHGGHILKARFVSSLALAAALALGATGCGMFAPQGTTDPYAPSDGIELTIDSIDVRNLLLVGDAAAENFNVVFTAVNRGDVAEQLNITFVDDSGTKNAKAQFAVAPGTNVFGELNQAVSATGGTGAQIVSIPGLAIGATVTAYVQVGTGQEVERQVPVLDGTLAEYAPLVPQVAVAS